MAQLTCDRLTLGYEGRTVSKDISFSVEAGITCASSGKTAPKSTLIKAILNLKPPVAGKVTLGDGLSRGSLGYLPSRPPRSAVFRLPSGNRDQRLPEPHGQKAVFGLAQRKRANDNMKKLQIDHLAKRCFAELSGGQQHRVLLARALCASDRMLILDEPASGLDPQITDEMYRLIKRLNEDGLTIIMVSHDTRAALRDATHILHLGDTPLFVGTVREYQQSDIGRFYLRREEAKA